MKSMLTAAAVMDMPLPEVPRLSWQDQQAYDWLQDNPFVVEKCQTGYQREMFELIEDQHIVNLADTETLSEWWKNGLDLYSISYLDDHTTEEVKICAPCDDGCNLFSFEAKWEAQEQGVTDDDLELVACSPTSMCSEGISGKHAFHISWINGEL